MDIVLEKAIRQVKVVDTERSYWFIRSYSGELFEHFYEQGYVGLGLNNVPYQYIKNAVNPNEDNYAVLFDFINKNTPYSDKEATKWANQLIYFEHNVKVGDVIITPSKNSARFAFGIVRSDTYLERNPGAFKFKDSYESYPEKRRRVDWLKIMSKEIFQGEMRNLMSTHQAIRLANDYSEAIEGNLSSLYIKDEHIFLTIRVNQEEDINAFELNRFLNALTFFYKEFCREYGIPENEDLTIKIKLQSKGVLALKATGFLAVVGIAGLIALSDNSVVSAKFDPETNAGELSFKSDGFLASLTNFLNAKQERDQQYQIFLESRKNLKVNAVPPGIEDKSLKTDTIAVEDSTGNHVIKIQHTTSEKPVEGELPE